LVVKIQLKYSSYCQVATKKTLKRKKNTNNAKAQRRLGFC